MTGDERLRADIVEIGRRVYARGYVASNDGNISVRLDEKRILTTPTGVSKGFMTPDMMVVTDLAGEKVAGDRNASSELLMHIAVYEQRPDVRAVVHAHPPTATGFAVAGIPLDRAVLAEVVTTLGSIPIADYGTPSTEELADAVSDDAWDIGLIGAEPARAEHIDFTAAYVEIEATYLVLENSPLKQLEDVDQPGIRIAVSARSAYDLYLTRHLKHAELVRAEGLDASYELFVQEGLDALAGLKPRLLFDVETLGQARLLEGRFTAVQQAIGTPANRKDSAVYLRSFVETAKASGLVEQLISRHQVKGLSVAPAV